MSHPPTPIRIFMAYSRKDADYLNEIRIALNPLERRGDIKLWYDGAIVAGQTWDNTIKENLHQADIVLLLLSSDSLASDYFYEQEVTNALVRHHKGESKVVPIIVRDCLWEETQLAELQALPQDAKPIVAWTNPNAAYRSIAVGVRELVEEIQHNRKERTAESERLTAEREKAERLQNEARERRERERQQTEQDHLRAEREKMQNKRQFWEQLKDADALFDEKQYAQALTTYQNLLNWGDKTEMGYTDAQPHITQRVFVCKNEARYTTQKKRAFELHQQGKYADALALTKQLLQHRTDPEAGALQNELTRLMEAAAAKRQKMLQKGGLAAGALLLLFLTIWGIGKLINNYTEPEMVFIKGGTFEMGSNDGESDENPVHSVSVDDFYMGKYEVTLAQFKAFIDDSNYQTDAEKEGYSWKWTAKWVKMEGINWRHDAEGKTQTNDQHPVIHVSWNDAMEYCKWLSGKTGKTYTLPTEAQWEYAAGNGNRHTKYAWGNGNPTQSKGGNVADETKHPSDGVAWSTKFEDYTDGYWFTAPVGQFGANDFGLYDMTGNVWEWCRDWYAANYYSNSPSRNPENTTSATYRVLRGGAWCSDPRRSRVAYRRNDAPANRGNRYGFRLALAPQF